ncbi:protein lethal(2)essential for life-like [Pectinophora gossypiella]|uniref:protein lethal(2)essential for life-like n=1 Tax=Pectinophora gossypiella TaxID=13191 RepID=UPI00214EB9FC|nr:protein lethal(2)essential for life-like [Pectinophora gossypiella]
MSLLPYLLERQRALQQYLKDDDILNAIAPLTRMSGDYSLWRVNSDGSIKPDNGKFQVNLDVHHFAPDEVSVKTADGFVVIEGKHEEKRDEHGWVSRQFTRRYALPEGCNVEGVQSRLSSDGVLTVIAPLDTPANERIVPIFQTGPVRKEAQGDKMH